MSRRKHNFKYDPNNFRFSTIERTINDANPDHFWAYVEACKIYKENLVDEEYTLMDMYLTYWRLFDETGFYYEEDFPPSDDEARKVISRRMKISVKKYDEIWTRIDQKTYTKVCEMINSFVHPFL